MQISDVKVLAKRAFIEAAKSFCEDCGMFLVESVRISLNMVTESTGASISQTAQDWMMENVIKDSEKKLKLISE